eukprot:4879629-Pyramimonas_sp.AAC.3
MFFAGPPAQAASGWTSPKPHTTHSPPLRVKWALGQLIPSPPQPPHRPRRCSAFAPPHPPVREPI